MVEQVTTMPGEEDQVVLTQEEYDALLAGQRSLRDDLAMTVLPRMVHVHDSPKQTEAAVKAAYRVADEVIFHRQYRGEID